MFCTPGYLIWVYKELFRNGADGKAAIPGIIARARSYHRILINE